ncbi:MAG: 7-carboxy-7-deazaguanine synthase [Pseudomonadota bacterium]
MKTYAVKEAYYTLQGEGAQTGRAAVFLRFAGCNLWSGLERDRAGAVCSFCDTDFVGTDGPGGGRFAREALVTHIEGLWRAVASGQGTPYVVCTGGEPALQLDDDLVTTLHGAGFEVGIETNGTKPLPTGLDWICVSPKADASVIQTSGHELKIVYPQPLAQPDKFAGLDFEHFFLQPLDGPDTAANTQACIDYCRAHPQWRLSVQTHKVLGIE